MTKTIKAITVDDEIWNSAKAQAKKENRGMSNFIETVLIKYLEEVKEQITENPGE